MRLAAEGCGNAPAFPNALLHFLRLRQSIDAISLLYYSCAAKSELDKRDGTQLRALPYQ